MMIARLRLWAELLQASLARLQLDYVDVLFCHRPDPDTPIEVSSGSGVIAPRLCRLTNSHGSLQQSV